MADSIKVTFKDGKVRDFRHQPRAGGSYSLAHRYDGSFFVVIDEYHNETAFPVQDIQEVRINAGYRGW